MHWKIFTDANTPEKARKVLKRLIEKLAVVHSAEKIEPYHKGGFACSFSTFPEAKEWSEVVLESLALAQAIGRGWILTADIQSELEAWSNESAVAGVQNIHLVVKANA